MGVKGGEFKYLDSPTPTYPGFYHDLKQSCIVRRQKNALKLGNPRA